MSHRRKLGLALATTVAAAAVAAFAFFSMSATSTARADEIEGIQNLHCTIAPLPINLNTAETLTCTFDFKGNSHTFVADFQISTTPPFLKVSSCKLDGNAVHIGPCP
jgi:hypothetical protein